MRRAPIAALLVLAAAAAAAPTGASEALPPKPPKGPPAATQGGLAAGAVIETTCVADPDDVVLKFILTNVSLKPVNLLGFGECFSASLVGPDGEEIAPIAGAPLEGPAVELKGEQARALQPGESLTFTKRGLIFAGPRGTLQYVPRERGLYSLSITFTHPPADVGRNPHQGPLWKGSVTAPPVRFVLYRTTDKAAVGPPADVPLFWAIPASEADDEKAAAAAARRAADGAKEFVVPPDARIMLVAARRNMPTGGYDVAVESAEFDGRRLTVHLLFTDPAPGDAVTMVLTRPRVGVEIGRVPARPLEVAFMVSRRTGSGRPSAEAAAAEITIRAAGEEE
ncbi:MAG TPA: protease complex subunit PrcB family protein [Thermoguttaceae bacterium]|nr:protease complex subunit PrcB family protein [Thermoguttaceae bacterium]